MSMPEPAFDDDGYPTEATLKIIEVWPYQDFFTLMAFIRLAWKYDNRFTQDGDFFQLSTGGWSGNEDIIRALQANRMFWSLCWESSRRGGHHEFKIPRRPKAAADMTGGSSPPASEGGLQSPPPPREHYDGPFGDFP